MAAITAIYDHSIVTLDMVKEHLGISGTSEDITVGLMLGAAKRAADSYCQNWFTDANVAPESGESVAIPEDVEMWILERVSRDYYRRNEGVKRIYTYEVQDMAFGGDDTCKLDPYRVFFGV